MASRDTRSGGKRGGGGGKAKYGHATYTSKRPIGGTGLFVTCVRGKERRSAAEMMDLLDEVADRLYSPERLAAYAALPPAWQRQEVTPIAVPASLTLSGLSLLDSVTPAPQKKPQTPSEESDDEEFLDESIEDSIARELAALKAARSAGRRNINESGQRDGAAMTESSQPRVKKIRPRFMSLETGTECLAFIAFEKPYDPVEIVEAIIKDLQATGVSHTRYTNRLQPVVSTCHALTLLDIDALSHGLIEEKFTAFTKESGKAHVTYLIDTSVRNHSSLHSRETLVLALGGAVQALTARPNSPFTASADLTTPDLVILPIVYRNCYGISIAPGKLWSGKKGRKYNLDAIGMEVRREQAEADGVVFSGVRGSMGRSQEMKMESEEIIPE